MIELNAVDKEHLRATIDNEAWPSVVKVAEIAVQREQFALLNCSLDEKAEEVWKRKCRLEGAKAVLICFLNMRKDLNKLEK